MKQGRAARVHLIPSGFHSKYFDYRVSHTCCTSLKPLESTLKVKGENVIFHLPFFIPYIFPIVTSHSVAQMVRNLPAMHETGFNPWVMKISWRKAWQPTPVFLPGESHGQRSLAGYSPSGCTESDMTKQLTFSLSQCFEHYITTNCWNFIKICYLKYSFVVIVRGYLLII